jgi:ATP-dependent helicase IRC3
MKLLGLMSDPTPALSLRDYQLGAREAIATNFFTTEALARAYRQLVVLPTGTGKTVLFASIPQEPDIAKWLEQFPPDRRKLLVIAHREELLNQAAEKISHANPDLVVEIEQADRHASPDADVIVASIQTLAMRAGKRMAKFERDSVRIIIIDEAHHATASSYQAVLKYFGLLPEDDFIVRPPPQRDAKADEKTAWQRERLAAWDQNVSQDRLLLGLTATPRRGDNIGLEAVFQRIVYSKNIREMIKSGYLTPLVAYTAKTKTSLDGIKTVAGDLDQGQLANAVNTPERNQTALDAWKQAAEGRKTIAFTVDVQHAVDACSVFNDNGVPSRFIHGAMSSDERRQILAEFKARRFLVLFNCAILTEGFDDPEVSCVLHLKPTKSSLLYIQMTGRGTRLSPGKKDCIVIDVVDISRKHSLMGSPELFGLPANFDVAGLPLDEVAEKVERAKKEHPALDLSEARSMKDIEALIEQVDLWAQANAADPVVESNANMLWVKHDDKFLRMEYPVDEFTKESIELKKNTLGKWDVFLKDSNSVRALSPKPIDDMAAAIRSAEDWVTQYRPKVAKLKQRNAPWLQAEATPAQVSYLMKLGAPINVGADGKPAQPITKGQAHTMIELLKHRSYVGGRVRQSL